ncbi:HNH endonuclease [Indiicoccus explosivorum]|uniref:HNH endonuclease n=1 Tax=Indiicoccus explosivorum TaxID=1917864 RepID=UPI000B442247|nr:HNH endonuclease [Indiicoccus explosivorum]
MKKEMKKCARCEETKAIAEFNRDSKARDGRQTYCRTCKDELRKASYGTFERKCTKAKDRANQKAKRYGAESTLTLQEVKEVLGGTHCNYCNKPLEQSEKTLEHVLPFECGGANTFGNVTLACTACNSRKHVLPAFEFILLNGDAEAARRLLETLAERNGVTPTEYLYTLARAGIAYRTARLRRIVGVEAQ